jgi:hypothetical protein
MDIRTLVLGFGVFCVTFLVGWWLNIGSVFYAGTSQRRPAMAAEGSATTGQGQSQGQPGPRFVAHVPVPVSTGTQRPATAQPKVPAARLPQVKYAQEPKAKASSNSSSAKPAIRRR